MGSSSSTMRQLTPPPPPDIAMPTQAQAPTSLPSLVEQFGAAPAGAPSWAMDGAYAAFFGDKASAPMVLMQHQMPGSVVPMPEWHAKGGVGAEVGNKKKVNPLADALERRQREREREDYSWAEFGND